MKRHYIYFALFVLFFSLPACEMKKEILGQLDEEEMTEPSTEGMGVLDLELNPEREAAIPDTKGATVSSTDSLALDVEAFSIDILNASGTTVAHYDTYADLRDEGGLLLPAGDYTVRASLGDDVNAGFDQPYYAGSTVCTITEQEVAKVVANCTLSNKKITFRCSERFLEQFDNDYAIVVDNNVGALTTNRTEERTAYLKNTGVLQFTLYATLRDGGRPLTYHYDLSKSGEVQEHNNVLVDLDLIDTPDEEPDEPSDPDEPADPGDPELPEDSVTMQAPIIKVDVSLIEKEFIIEIPSDFVDAGDGGDDTPSTPDDGDDDKPSAPSITGDAGLNLDQPIEISGAGNRTVRVLISTPGKLASLKVKITSSVLEALLPAVGLSSEFDVCDESLKETLAQLGLSATVGATSTVFDISEFMPMIAMLQGGDYLFTVTATDQAGQRASVTLTIRNLNENE